MIDKIKAYGWQLAALALAVLLFLQTTARHAAEMDAQTTRTTLATERHAASQAALAQSERYRKLEGTHRDELAKAHTDAQAAIAAADTGAARARAARDSVRRELADYLTAHRAAAQARAAAGDCTPDARPAGVLAELFDRADRRAGELAHIADTARARGTACERAYDSAHAMIEAARNAKAE